MKNSGFNGFVVALNQSKIACTKQNLLRTYIVLGNLSGDEGQWTQLPG